MKTIIALIAISIISLTEYSFSDEYLTLEEMDEMLARSELCKKERAKPGKELADYNAKRAGIDATIVKIHKLREKGAISTDQYQKNLSAQIMKREELMEEIKQLDYKKLSDERFKECMSK